MPENTRAILSRVLSRWLGLLNDDSGCESLGTLYRDGRADSIIELAGIEGKIFETMKKAEAHELSWEGRRDRRTAAQWYRKLFLQWFKSLMKPAWAPSFVFMIHVIALSFQLYKTYPPIDIPMHFFGGLSMAYFLHKAFVAASLITTGAPPNRLLESLLIFTATCMVAVFWEFIEFVLSWALSTDLQGSLADTTKDLLLGMIGSLCFTAAVNLPTYTASRLLRLG
jgi:hypothetical protein